MDPEEVQGKAQNVRAPIERRYQTGRSVGLVSLLQRRWFRGELAKGDLHQSVCVTKPVHQEEVPAPGNCCTLTAAPAEDADEFHCSRSPTLLSPRPLSPVLSS